MATTPLPVTSTHPQDASESLRWAIYVLLILLSAGSMLGRIMQVSSGSHTEPTPFLSANDRSRWSTIRALVDEGTWAIDSIIFTESGERNRAWSTIDLVRHVGTDGRDHYYSSKPTLFTTLLAAEYWGVQKLTGARLADKPLFVGRLMLVVTNVLPLLVAFVLLARLVERYGRTDLGRIFVMAVATQGTFLTTFAITLNNHLIAAVCLLFTLVAASRLWERTSASSWRFAAAGLFAAFTAANELPALAFLALLLAGLAYVSWRKTLLWALPPALLVAVAAIGTNYWAHGTWKTPYAQRKDGPQLALVQASAQVLDQLDHNQLPPEITSQIPSTVAGQTPTAIEIRIPGERWAIADEHGATRWGIKLLDDESKSLQVFAWQHWYDYPGTYWTPEIERTSVDQGEPSRGVYAANCLVGHHGIFSLSPVWLLSLIGLGLCLAGSQKRLEPRSLAAAACLLFCVVLGFYLSRSQVDRNYGGFCCGLRWMFWFIPIWLLALIPAADQAAQSRWKWAVALLLLGVSVGSAYYANLNPWRHPWLFDYWTYLGWINY